MYYPGGFSFISGRAVRVTELIKEDWPIVLQQEFRHKTTLYYFQKVLSPKYWSTKRV